MQKISSCSRTPRCLDQGFMAMGWTGVDRRHATPPRVGCHLNVAAGRAASWSAGHSPWMNPNWLMARPDDHPTSIRLPRRRWRSRERKFVLIGIPQPPRGESLSPEQNANIRVASDTQTLRDPRQRVRVLGQNDRNAILSGLGHNLQVVDERGRFLILANPAVFRVPSSDVRLLAS